MRRDIYRLQNDLVRLGVEVVTEKDEFVHVSGHPAREEMEEMYRLDSAAHRRAGPRRGPPP